MRRSQLTEQRQIQTMDAARERRYNSPPHGRRIFWSVLAGICWLIPALVWVLVFHGVILCVCSWGCSDYELRSASM